MVKNDPYDSYETSELDIVVFDDDQIFNDNDDVSIF